MPADQRPVMASSPPSSHEATHHDTPSTNLTAFSPEAGMSTDKNKSKAKAPLRLAPLADINNTLASQNEDVFLNAPVADGMRQLSPIADEFTPGGATFMPLTDANTYNVIAPATRPLGAGPLVQNSIPDFGTRFGHTQTTNAAGIIGRPTNAASNGSQLTQEMQSFNIVAFQDVIVREGTFSFDEGVARAYAVENCMSEFTLPTIVRLLNTGGIPTEGVDSTQLTRHRKIIISFDDVRDARKAIIAIHTNPLPYVSVMPYTARELAAHRGNSNSALCSLFEGQVLVSVYWDQDAQPGLGANNALAAVKQGLARFGEVKAFYSVPFNQRRIRDFRVEYFDVNCAIAIINYTRGRPYQINDNLLIEAVAYLPADFATRPSEQISITGRSMVPADNPAYAQIIGTLAREEGCNRRRGGHGQYTRIDVGRIREGLDVRTTVMLRNIPNRVTQAQLKEIMDETSLAQYDFMYLRIDFANNCNVGYAFINFVDPFAIIPFAETRQSKRWVIFNSTKVAEISYATIQGRENLVQKFRNSSVMLEHPSFRPKLFYTGAHANAGLEEPFPTPDNMQKMRRSVENAETVGLFPKRRYNPIFGMGVPSPGALPAPPAQMLRASHSGVPAVQSRGVQAAMRAPMPPTPESSSNTSSSPMYTQSSLSSGPTPSTGVFPHMTPPETPSVAPAPGVAPNAPLRITYPFSNLVDTSSPSDPFFGRADRLRLFAPRQGQVLREEQRRRVSQFDRGTPGAQLELQHSAGSPSSAIGYGAHADIFRYSGYHGN